MNPPSAKKYETYSGGYDPSCLLAMVQRGANREAAFFIPHLRPDMRILDCGCGPGGITLGLARLVSAGGVVGIDIEAEQLELGRQQAQVDGLTNVSFLPGSIYALPFEEESFEAVLAHGVLYHLGEPQRALGELYRVLKPGGLIGVRDADLDGDVYFPSNPEIDRFWKVAERVVAHHGGDARLGRRHRKMLREAGFVRLMATGSADAYGTSQSTESFSRFWADVFAVQHRQLILERQWAQEHELEAMSNALRAWGAGEDSFYSRCRCEAVGWKPERTG